MVAQIGVLLVNLGTPASYELRDVYRYLIEFLTDSRVIDIPWWRRQLLVRGLVVPSRCRTTAASYRHIWTAEGSPLLVYSQKVVKLLQKELGACYHVALAMRYQTPSIDQVIREFGDMALRQLIVVPLFPQYASATTGSVHQRVMEQLLTWPVIPELSLINNYATHPLLIRAFSDQIKLASPSSYDHLIFSFHGLPERQIRRCDPCGSCLQRDCCSSLSMANNDCYSAQCYATARAIAESLGFSTSDYTVAFQSRLGKEPWLRPYTVEIIDELQRRGHSRLLVASPSFVTDCLETLYEIGVEYGGEFKKRGGQALDLVPGLHESPSFITALKSLVESRRVVC